MAEKKNTYLTDVGIHERLAQSRVHEPATQEDITMLGKQVAALADMDKFGTEHAFSDKAAPTLGYTVLGVPREFVPKDAMSEFNPAKPVHLHVSFDTAKGDPTVEFSQMHSVDLSSGTPRSVIMSTRVQYDLSGEGQRRVQLSKINQAEFPLRPEQQSSISKGAVAQLTYALNRPELQPQKPVKKL